MNRIRNLFKQIIHDSFLYKKRLILSILGILISTIILNVGLILVNYQSSQKVELAEYSENTGVYYGVKLAFPYQYFDAMDVSYAEEDVTNCVIPDSKIKISLYGVNYNFLDYPVTNVTDKGYVSETKLIYGDNLTEADVLQGNKYIYLEESYCSMLFNENPLGKIVEVNKKQFIVKGVLKDTPSTKRYLKGRENTVLQIRGYTTITAVQTEFENDYNDLIIFKYDKNLDVDSVIWGDMYFTYDMAKEKEKESRSELVSSLTPIFIVTLMAMSVLEVIIIIFNLKERNAEIGIKRAIGATRDEICFEFVLEIVIVGIIGILIGIGLSLALDYIISVQYFVRNFYYVSFIGFSDIILTSGFVLGIIVFSSLIPIAFVANINIVDVVKGE